MDNKEPRQILPPEETQNSDIDALITAEHYQTGQFNSYDYNESLFDRVTSALADNKLLLIPIVAVPVLLIGLALGVNGTNSNEQADEETVSLAEQVQDTDDSMRPVSINTLGDEESDETSLTPTSTPTHTTTTNTTSNNTRTSTGSTRNIVQEPISPDRDPELDVCPNQFGIQTTVPINLTLDSKGNCVRQVTQDVCPNLFGIQLALPAGKSKDAAGNCVDIVQDLCKNIKDTQTAVPKNYVRGTDGNCTLDMCLNIANLQVTVPTTHIRDTKGNCNPKPTTVASKIDLRPWKVTLPVGSGGKPIDINPATSRLYPPWYAKSGSNYVFYVDSARATARTKNSPNIRSELRELQGGKDDSWNPRSGVHQLLVRLKVTKNTGARTIVLAQIHGDERGDNDPIQDDDTTVFRLEGTKLWLTRGDTNHGCDPHINIALNQVVTIGYKVTGGKVYYYFSPTGAKNPGLISRCSGWTPVKGPDDNTDIGADFRDGVYFKTGNYQQSSGYGGRSESAVTIMGLGIAHNTNGKLPDIGGN